MSHPLPGRALRGNVPRGVSQSRPFFACFCGTFSPSRRQIRSTIVRQAICIANLPGGALVVHMPTAVVQHPGDHAISVAPKLSRQLDDILGQPLLIWQAARDLALRGAMLPEDAAGPAL
jgi:hypothetical protein